MVYIDYMGIDPIELEFLTSPALKSALEAHPNLWLVTSGEDEDGDEIFHEVTFPLSDYHHTAVGIEDHDEEESFMWILYDDCVSVTDPSPGFVAVLRAMDDYSVETLGERLFMPKDASLCTDDDSVLEAEFDFTQGDYRI